MQPELKETRTRGEENFPFELYEMKTVRDKLFVACHWQEDMEILILISGQVELLLNGTPYLLRAGEVAFINPFQLHQIRGLTFDTMYYAYVFPLSFLLFEKEEKFQTDILRPLTQQILAFPATLSDADVFRTVEGLLKNIIQLNQKKPYTYEIQTKTLLLELFCTLAQNNCFIKYRFPKQIDTCKKILYYLQKHYNEKISVPDIASETGLSPNYFSAFFTEHFKQSFSSYLMSYRITQACHLLETTNLSITEIALATGFSTASYFISTFKRIKGITPYHYIDTVELKRNQ